MSDEQQSAQEKTEQPTERRLQEARKQGQIARSRELNTMLSLLFGAAGLLVFGSTMSADFVSLFESSLTFDREVAFDTNTLALRFMVLVLESVIILVPLFAVLTVGALVGPMMMGGWAFSPAAMAFKLSKLDPVKGLGRVFSAKGLLELLKALFKFVILAITTVILFDFLLDQLMRLGELAPQKALVDALNILRWCLLVLSFAMIFIVVFDVPFELWNHKRQLKMTRQEVLDELKESDGRPEVKNRIRMLQREMSQRRMMEAIPTADVVVTNPTHYAVALQYEGMPGQAPVVVAKGQDLIAQKIRGVAQANDVALFEAPPLARALYASTEIGDEIPENLYMAVAQVLAYVYQLRTAGAANTERPEDIPVPDMYRDLPINRGMDLDE